MNIIQGNQIQGNQAALAQQPQKAGYSFSKSVRDTLALALGATAKLTATAANVATVAGGLNLGLIGFQALGTFNERYMNMAHSDYPGSYIPLPFNSCKAQGLVTMYKDASNFLPIPSSLNCTDGFLLNAVGSFLLLLAGPIVSSNCNELANKCFSVIGT